MGDFVLVGTGEASADCLPQRAVTVLTEANVALSGDGSSLTEETSTLGGGISFNTAGFGLSATDFVGSIGRGRENLDWPTVGAGDAALGVSIGFGSGAGDAALGVSTGLGSGAF